MRLDAIIGYSVSLLWFLQQLGALSGTTGPEPRVCVKERCRSAGAEHRLFLLLPLVLLSSARP
jgi:hypothetical protein